MWSAAICVSIEMSLCQIVDCQPLRDVVCGHMRLHTPFLRPVFTRITRSVMGILEAGWLPATLVADPVHWVPREQNSLADAFANRTMDIERTWGMQWPLPPRLQDIRHNVFLQSDGGYLGDKAAAAWAIVAAFGVEVHILAARGVYLPTTRSSFTAEAIALEDGLNSLKRLCGTGALPNLE